MTFALRAFDTAPCSAATSLATDWNAVVAWDTKDDGSAGGSALRALTRTGRSALSVPSSAVTPVEASVSHGGAATSALAWVCRSVTAPCAWLTVRRREPRTSSRSLANRGKLPRPRDDGRRSVSAKTPKSLALARLPKSRDGSPAAFWAKLAIWVATSGAAALSVPATGPVCRERPMMLMLGETKPPPFCDCDPKSTPSAVVPTSERNASPGLAEAENP